MAARGGFRIAGIPVTLTPGAYLLGVLAAGFGALTLPVVDPGQSVAGYLAAALAWSSSCWAAWSRMNWRTRSWPAVTASACRSSSASSAACGTAGRCGPGSAAEQELPGPGAQWRVAAAGPLTSLVLGLVGVAGAVFLPMLGAGLLIAAVAAAAAWINGLLAVGNLIPGAGLDGGRIVRALAWARSGDSTRAGLIAARFGQVSGAILTVAGVTAAGARPSGRPLARS